MPPTALLETLRAIGRKVKFYGVVIGAWRIVAAAVGLLVAAVGVDWLAHETGATPGGLPGGARLVLELAVFATLIYWFFRWVIRPAMRTHTAHDVAGWVEQRHPHFGDTLSSTVNFLSTDVPGSTAMKDRVIRDATEQAGKSDLNAVIDRRPLHRASMVAALSVVGLVVLAILVGPAFRKVAVSWLLHPLSGDVWPKTVQISLDGNTPARIAVGEPLPVRVKLSRGDRNDRRVIVRYRYDDGRWQEQVMDRGPDGAYAAALDTRLDEGKKSGAMAVSIVAGDDEIALAPVTIVPRLDVSLVEADITSPAYVRATNQSKVNLTERPAVMAMGSTVDLQLRFNKPLAANVPVEISPTRPGTRLSDVHWERPAPDLAIAHFPADQSFRFTVHATDTDSFRNIGAAEYELIVREDTSPTVQIEEPRRSEDHTAVAEFPLKAVAEDDYGIDHAQLVVQRISSSAPATRPAGAPKGDAGNAAVQTSDSNKWVIDLVQNTSVAGAGISWRESGGTVDRRRYELEYDWDLARLQDANLKAGDVLEYFVQVKDNFDLNGRQHDWAPSGKLRITIISQEQFATAVQTQLENIHSQLNELYKGQIRNRTETDALRQMTQRKAAFDEADRVQAERLAGQQSNTASQTMQVAQRLAELTAKIQQNKVKDSSLQQTSQSVQTKLQSTAEGTMKEASRNINNARDQKAESDPAPRQPRAGDQQVGQQQLARATTPQEQAQAQAQADQQQQANSQGQQQKGQQNTNQQAGDQQARDQQQDRKQSQGDPQAGKQQDGKQQEGGQQAGNPQDGKQQDGKQQDGKAQDGKAQDGKAQDGKAQDGKAQDGKAQDGKQQEGGKQSGQQQDGKQQQGAQPAGKQQDGRPQEGGQQANKQQGGQQAGKQQDGKQQSGQPQQGGQQQQSGEKQQGGQRQQGGQQQQGQKQQGQQPQDQQSQGEQSPQQKLRNDAMAKATDSQQKAADEIKDAMERIGNFDGLSEFRAKLEEIKDKQSKLGQQYNKASKGQIGKKPEQLTPEKRDELAKIAQEQKDLARQTENTLEQMNKKADSVQRTDSTSAQAMKQAAQTGNQQQVPGKQQQASQSMQQNQQAQAEQAEQQAEIGLQMVIGKLADAERRKLEELQAKLAEAQQLIDDLVRRQSGHNIDNLMIQGGDRLKKMESADRDALYANASREEKDPQDSRTPRDLNTSQRVTERNARDVAKKIEQLPDSAPAAKITVAAGHMERAIVSLNNDKLAEAYEPPQVDAYAALLEARTMVEKSLNKAQEDLKQQQKETIRQAYVKLLTDQKKIGVDIKSIDVKSQQGALPRPIAIRLGQLPGDQGGLSERAGKLGEQLEQLDSIVYVWANGDIVKTMNEVKDDLAKPVTAAPTQAEETRIEDQLQAMIDSLKIKPRKSDFNERQQKQQQAQQPGQPGQKPKAKMPSEAELALLKALQVAVNRSTTTIDADKTKDKPKLLSLGGRQGELRELLDKMVQKATQGKVKLAAEPDNRDQLPEEAAKGAVEDAELNNMLLNAKAGDDESVNSIKLTGDRMARSRQRLALNNDPGKVTQEIQKRILIDIDSLIQQAQAQQQQQQQRQQQRGQRPQPQPGQQPNRGQQQVAQQQQNRQQGQNPAQQSVLGQGEKPVADISQDIKAQIREWGKLHGRERDAIVEAENEKVNPKYQKLVDDYFKALSEKSTEQQR